MEVTVVNEEGYDQAIYGIGLSYGITDFDRLESVALKLKNKDGGHNKFLESIQVWIEIRAARYWWQEFDTYRVGTTKQSESTIHTIARKPLEQSDFQYAVMPEVIEFLNNTIELYNDTKNESNSDMRSALFKAIKNNLPEGYLQTRMVNTNYRVLRNMIKQRRNHVMDEWHIFIKELREHLIHGFLLEDCYEG